MCLVSLNVSTLACQHRWYHLQRPCRDGLNLSTCTGKITMSGIKETKINSCPHCDGSVINDPSSYRLIGNDRTPSIGGLSRSSSSSLASARRDSRRGSLAHTDSSAETNGTIFPLASLAEMPLVQSTAQKNQATNARVHAYINALPEAVNRARSRDGWSSDESASQTGDAESVSGASTSLKAKRRSAIWGQRLRGLGWGV
ncbi:hypothetical protein LTS18_006375 [Coniosporium uncinatum]|uniref:Uncharacterized protein n=1 Tax=Coniosporium uncinatum TaxID=93489 RepID=A0ACC3DQS9_9PEZI|nr:hypothetical protein LTS18_006375 [Coniosporium uncinatum]